jgi:hypothetical protein
VSGADDNGTPKAAGKLVTIAMSFDPSTGAFVCELPVVGNPLMLLGMLGMAEHQVHSQFLEKRGSVLDRIGPLRLPPLRG